MSTVTNQYLRRRAAWTGVVAACALALIAALGTNPANAAFTSLACEGSNIQGRGASFQAAAQTAWKTFFETDSTVGCAAASPIPVVSYDSAGSGAGRTAMGGSNGVRDAAIRYAGTDESPTPASQALMNAGDPNISTDNGQIHVIPVAQAANTVFVNFPSGCRVPPGSPNETTYNRIKLSNTVIEEFFRGLSTRDKWGELVPDIEQDPASPTRTTLQCQSKLVKRVVRLDNSGTTFSFKQYLKAINPSFTWEQPGLANQTWPNDTGGTAVLRGTGNGNGPLADKVFQTDGAIGYGDLATARAKGFRKAGKNSSPQFPWSKGNFWLPLQDPSGTYHEPTATTDAIQTGRGGSNCSAVRYSNVPGDNPGSGDAINTFGDWSTVTGTMYPGAYPLCTLTYALVFDDHADVYGNTPAEEAKARTVKDFFTAVTSSSGQSLLQSKDYYPLPTSVNQNLRGVAQAAVAGIDWNKP